MFAFDVDTLTLIIIRMRGGTALSRLARYALARNMVSLTGLDAMAKTSTLQQESGIEPSTAQENEDFSSTTFSGGMTVG